MSKPGARVPLFSSWRNAYLAVVAVFVVEVALFYALSRFFS
ncbi:MAG: hypothetical protein ACR2ID_03530 [Chthoniobacterales bacterium]